MRTEVYLDTREKVERALLGCLLLDFEPSVQAAVLAGIKSPESFANLQLRALYETMLEMAQDGEPVTGGTVYLEMSRRNRIKDRAHAARVCALISEASDSAPAPAAAKYIASLLAEYSARDAITMEAASIPAKLDSGEPDVVAAQSAKRLIEIAEGIAERASEVQDAGESLRSGVEAIERIRRGQSASGAKFRIPTLDSRVVLDPGMFVTIAARPSAGKSTLLGQVAIESALKEVPTLFITLEMPTDRIVARCLSYMSGVPINVIYSAEARGFFGDQSAHYNTAKADYGCLPLHVWRPKRMTEIDFEATVGRYVKEHGIRLVLLDYIQLARPSQRHNNRDQEIAALTGAIRTVVAAHNVVVVAASQMNREIEKRPGKPRLADLRESGAIENDSDTVIFIHHENAEDKELESVPVTLVIGKNRNGPGGEVKCTYNKPTFTFAEQAI